MKLEPSPDGETHEHLGVSHTVKHYLEPAEVWEDFAEAVVPELRPTAVIDRLALPRRSRWADWKAAPVEAHLHWDELRQVHRGGYIVAVRSQVDERDEPPRPPWFALPRDRFVAHLGAGLIAIVWWFRNRWELKTAYRTLYYPFAGGVELPQDAFSRKCRARLAEAHASRRMLGILASKDDE